MDDALLVRRFERFGNLPRDRNGLVDRDRAARDALRQILAFDQLHDDYRATVRVLEAENRADVRVVQGGECFRFALKSREALGIGRKHLGQRLEGNVTIQLCVARAVNLAHSAGPEGTDDFIRADARASRKTHSTSAL